MKKKIYNKLIITEDVVEKIVYLTVTKGFIEDLLNCQLRRSVCT